MLRFHVAHLLFELVRHATGLEAWIKLVDSLTFRLFYRGVVNNVFYRDVLEELQSLLLYWSRLEIRLLRVILLRLFRLLAELLVRFLPVLLLRLTFNPIHELSSLAVLRRGLRLSVHHIDLLRGQRIDDLRLLHGLRHRLHLRIVERLWLYVCLH